MDDTDELEIRLLGICGSPRRKATDFAVNEALRYAHEEHGVAIDFFSAHQKRLGFCVHCDACVRTRQGCAFKDDMEELYAKLDWADAMILGTPVYQGTMTGQLKVMLDRCRAIVMRDPNALRHKVGAGIAVGGDRCGGQEPALQAIIDFFIINGMVPVGGGSYGANLGAAVWSRDRGVAGVRADEQGLSAIRRVVDHVVATVRVVNRGRQGV